MQDIELVSIQEEHIEMIRQWRNSPEVSSYMYSQQEITEEQQKQWFKNISNDPKSRYWLIQYDSKPIGLVSLTGIDYTLNSCYWAFYLGDTSVRGGGIGAKVEITILKYVFNDLKLNKLRCEVFTSNHKVIRMHEKFGFRREAYYREHCRVNNKYEDVVGLAILKSEWEVQKDNMIKKVYGE